MRSKSGPQSSAEEHVREIRRQTRKRYSSQEKIRIVLEGMRGEYAIAELCRREGILKVSRDYAAASAFEHFRWGILPGFLIAALCGYCRECRVLARSL